MINSSSVLPEISQNDFFSCSAAQDGGGFYIYGTTSETDGVNIPVHDCRFISCIANGIASWSSDNEADGGGLIFWENEKTFGICNSLFTKCKSMKRAGGSFFTIRSDYFDGIIRFCFYSKNTADKGRNALVHFYISDDSIWSNIFFHSFTSDNDLSNSLIKDYPDVKEVTHNWLRKATINHKEKVS